MSVEYKTQSQEQPKQEAIEDAELLKFASDLSLETVAHYIKNEQEAIEDKKMPDIEELIEKFLPNKFDLSTFKPKQILFLKSAFQQGAAVMFHELKNRSSDKAALLSQQNPNAEKQVSEKIAGYVHEIDSLHISKRELWKKLAAEKLILIEKIAAQEIEIASLKSKIKELQSDYMAVQTEIQSNESK